MSRALAVTTHGVAQNRKTGNPVPPDEGCKLHREEAGYYEPQLKSTTSAGVRARGLDLVHMVDIFHSVVFLRRRCM